MTDFALLLVKLFCGKENAAIIKEKNRLTKTEIEANLHLMLYDFLPSPFFALVHFSNEIQCNENYVDSNPIDLFYSQGTPLQS